MIRATLLFDDDREGLIVTNIGVPIWILLPLTIMSALWVLQHFLVPSVRWFFRRRANRLIEDVNNKLALRLPSFKLTRREILIDRLIYHKRVLALVDELAKQEDVPHDILMDKVQTYAKEIVPAFNALLYFKAAYWCAKHLLHGLYRVRLGFSDDKALAELDENSSVVFVMNHRSNMDYILATYLAAERTALSYAVGEWARVWPLRYLIRSMGGFFVRRESGNALYRRVLEVYVQMSAEGGVPQAIFPEGKLSRDGLLGKSKLGLLGYLIRGFDPNATRDIVFVPVGINYDRVLEDRTLLRSTENLPKPTTLYAIKTGLSFVAKNLWQALIGKRYRNGYACVNFGKPLSLKQWIATQHDSAQTLPLLEDATQLADAIMERIENIIPILPAALVATVFIQNPDTNLSELEIKSQVFALLQRLEANGHKAYLPRSDIDYATSVGIRMFTLRRVLLESDDGLRINPDDVALLRYYANSIKRQVDAIDRLEHIQPPIHSL